MYNELVMSSHGKVMEVEKHSPVTSNVYFDMKYTKQNKKHSCQKYEPPRGKTNNVVSEQV